MRRAIAVATLALAVACGRKKAAPDGAAAGAAAGKPTLPPPDTLKAAPAASADSAQVKKPVDSKSASTKKTAAQAAELGRDSVRQGPIGGIPAIRDTAKKKP